MPRRWRAYKSLEWFIFAGFAMAAFFALVATVMLITGGRQARVVVFPVTPQPMVAVSPQLTPIPTPISTDGWQTYRNEELGYSVKYPAGWELRAAIAGLHGSIGFIPPTGSSTYGCEIIAYDNPQRLSSSAWMKWNSDTRLAEKSSFLPPRGAVPKGYELIEISVVVEPREDKMFLFRYIGHGREPVICGDVVNSFEFLK